MPRNRKSKTYRRRATMPTEVTHVRASDAPSGKGGSDLNPLASNLLQAMTSDAKPMVGAGVSQGRLMVGTYQTRIEATQATTTGHLMAVCFQGDPFVHLYSQPDVTGSTVKWAYVGRSNVPAKLYQAGTANQDVEEAFLLGGTLECSNYTANDDVSARSVATYGSLPDFATWDGTSVLDAMSDQSLDNVRNKVTPVGVTKIRRITPLDLSHLEEEESGPEYVILDNTGLAASGTNFKLDQTDPILFQSWDGITSAARDATDFRIPPFIGECRISLTGAMTYRPPTTNTQGVVAIQIHVSAAGQADGVRVHTTVLGGFYSSTSGYLHVPVPAGHFRIRQDLLGASPTIAANPEDMSAPILGFRIVMLGVGASQALTNMPGFAEGRMVVQFQMLGDYMRRHVSVMYMRAGTMEQSWDITLNRNYQWRATSDLEAKLPKSTHGLPRLTRSETADIEEEAKLAHENGLLGLQLDSAVRASGFSRFFRKATHAVAKGAKSAGKAALNAGTNLLRQHLKDAIQTAAQAAPLLLASGEELKIKLDELDIPSDLLRLTNLGTVLPATRAKLGATVALPDGTYRLDGPAIHHRESYSSVEVRSGAIARLIVDGPSDGIVHASGSQAPPHSFAVGVMSQVEPIQWSFGKARHSDKPKDVSITLLGVQGWLGSRIVGNDTVRAVESARGSLDAIALANKVWRATPDGHKAEVFRRLKPGFVLTVSSSAPIVGTSHAPALLPLLWKGSDQSVATTGSAATQGNGPHGLPLPALPAGEVVAKTLAIQEFPEISSLAYPGSTEIPELAKKSVHHYASYGELYKLTHGGRSLPWSSASSQRASESKSKGPGSKPGTKAQAKAPRLSLPPRAPRRERAKKRAPKVQVTGPPPITDAKVTATLADMRKKRAKLVQQSDDLLLGVAVLMSDYVHQAPE